jgi:hypothetical protein
MTLNDRSPRPSYPRREWRLFAFGLAALFGGLQAWASRFYIEPDAVNYLDLARTFSKGDWNGSINTYWSSLYPWVVGLCLRLLNPAPYWESTLLHVVNLAIFLLALLCFEFFFAALLDVRANAGSVPADDSNRSAMGWWILGYGLFFYSSLFHISLAQGTPDMLVAACTYLIVGMILQIYAGAAQWKTFILFGVTLGVAYLAKAFMFPMALLFIGIAFLAHRDPENKVQHLTASVALFALLASPYVYSVSRKAGHLTFGETGRLNYVWYVDAFDSTNPHWHGEISGLGKPIHAPRQIFESPRVNLFTEPIRATYPPWFEPYYWWAGVKPHFELRGQLHALRLNIGAYFKIVSAQKELVAGIILLVVLERRRRNYLARLCRLWPVWVPGMIALGLYALIHTETRLVAPFLVLVWAALFRAAWPDQLMEPRKLITAVSVAVAFPLALTVLMGGLSNLIQIVRPAPHVQWIVAETIQQMGLKSGDKVAFLGHSNRGDYWAHLAGVTVGADVPKEDVAQFWLLKPTERSEIYRQFTRAGIKAVVTDAPTSADAPGEWSTCDGTGYSAHFLGESTGPADNSAK